MFFHLLNAEKKQVAFDFTSLSDRADLLRLLEAADIVIEASRPRALQQMGIHAEKLTATKPGKVWLRFTAHGAGENRIGFGDDIGVAAGLSRIMEKAWGEPLFAGDAIADPVAGILGALAAWTKWRKERASGGGWLLDLSMCDTLRHAIHAGAEQVEAIQSGAAQSETMPLDDTRRDWSAIASRWQAMAEADENPLYPARRVQSYAADTGADTGAVMAGLR